MKNISLQNDNEIPQIGLGTWQLRDQECTKTICDSIEIGYTHIDTAQIYKNQEAIGKAIKDVEREKLFITSKVWYLDLGYDDVIISCENTLAQLQTSYIDLLLIHWPNKDIEMRETFRAFKDLLERGKIKAMGVSNFTISHLRNALLIAQEVGIDISVNQVEFHPFLYQKELLDFCNQHNIVLTAYSPLARGQVMQDTILRAIGAKYGKSAAQVALRWLLDKGVVVIPKASSKEHLQSNIDVFNFTLTAQEQAQIDTLNKNKRLVDPSFAEFKK